MKAVSIIKYVFTFLGLVFFAIATYLYFSKKAFLNKAEIAQGVVIDIVMRNTTRSVVYSPVISFTTKEGEQIEFISFDSSSTPHFDDGEEVEILYDPHNPHDAIVNEFSSLYMTALIVGSGGVEFFLTGFSLFLYSYLKRRKKQLLLKNGKPIVTKFVDVKIKFNLRINGRNPFQIRSQWMHPSTNVLYVFESENILFDPMEFIKTDEIKVFIDPNNPKNYYMDISFLPGSIDN